MPGQAIRAGAADEKTIHAGIDAATLSQDGKAVSLQTLAFGRAEAEIQWTLPETNGLACSGKGNPAVTACQWSAT